MKQAKLTTKDTKAIQALKEKQQKERELYNQQVPFKCPKCNCSFTTKEDRAEHYTAIHAPQEEQ